MRYDKAALLANSRAVGEAGLAMHTKSLVGLGDTVVTTVEETFDDGSSQMAYAVVRFNDQGQAVQMYANVPVLRRRSQLTTGSITIKARSAGRERP